MAGMKRDEVFRKAQEAVADFRFGVEVAAVFDDMLVRSVPFYSEVQRMIAEMASDFVQPGTCVVDLGCSTGTTFLCLDPALPADVTLVGVDNSEEMLTKCRSKLAEYGMRRPLELRCADLNLGVAVENVSMALLILTLQFVRPMHRDRLIADLHRGLNENGCLVVVEKVLGEDSYFNRCSSSTTTTPCWCIAPS